MEAACSGASRQYDGSFANESCSNLCTLWPQGTPGDESGNSLECRAYHAGAALSDPQTHCAHAGPFGGGVCGASRCETFCSALVAMCTPPYQVYDSELDCRTDCEAYSDASVRFTADADDTTDSFRCRAYHLTQAALDPGTHCPHAGGPNATTPSPVCTL